MSLRNDLIANAVAFLQEPAVSESSLAKKIEFLQSKGLNDTEIQEALRQAGAADTGRSPGPGPPPPVKDYAPTNYTASYPYNRPVAPERDWKDLLIMGAATAGLAYGVYQVAKRYIVPKIVPSSKAELAKEKEGVDQEFLRIEALLTKFEHDQDEFYKKQEAKSKQIDETITQIDAVITQNNKKNLQNEETLKYLKLEVDNIKTTLMRSMESQKQTIGGELSSLETQLEELKAELSAERSGANYFTSSTGNSSRQGSVAARPAASTGTSSTTSNGSKASASKAASKASTPLDIPSTSDIPSVDEVLKGDRSKVPAWQKTAMEQDPDQSIPKWQMAG